MSRLVAALAPRKRALILPVYDRFFPGAVEYESLAADLRRTGVAMFGFVEPFGIMEEGRISGNPEVFSFSRMNEGEAVREMLVRTRAWLDCYGPRYGEIVVVTNNNMREVWTQALRGPMKGKQSPIGVSDRITLVRAHPSRGMKGKLFKNRLLNILRR